jgi:hypothetical protein
MRILAIILLIFCLGCSGKKNEGTPPGILSPAELVPVLADIHLAEAAATLKTSGGEATNQYAKSHDEFIFKLYGISREKFEKSLEHYARDPVRFDALYEEVINELSRKQAEAAQLKP